MERLVLVLLVLAGVYLLQSNLLLPSTTETPPVELQYPEARHEPTGQRFQCDGRRYCSEMTSREEAVFFIRHCPDTRMDGDRDGIPCENDSRW